MKLKKKVSTLWGVIIIVISAVVLFGGAFAYQYFAKPQTSITPPARVGNDQQNSGEQVMCTMDAMQCPDGSYVGRTGPNCEFVCPTTTEATDTNNWKTYTNDEYGFGVKLPDSWNGYSVEKQQWTGWAISGNDIKYFGVKIIIKNPNTTQEQVWQDIPILLFSKDQWKLVTDEELAVSAAPIGPEKIGENSKYIFATPPRWYGFTDAKGWQEAVDIVKTFKAF